VSDAPIVFVVDDDRDVRDSLRLLLESVGLQTEVFADAGSFLRRYAQGLPRTACLVLDVRMPGMSGMTLFEHLVEAGARLPVIVITGHGDIPMAVKATKMGAVDFITKPFNHQALLDLVQNVLRSGHTAADEPVDLQALVTRWDGLTEREREVFHQIVAGKANKVISIDLGISIRTVETHRARIMHKMGARSLVELVLMSVQMKNHT
jgi:FixJ family two-component response regulator